MKKRIISIMVILTVLLSSSYSFAETATSTNENDYVPSYEELIQDKDVIILNEVDIIQDLQKQTDQTLKQDGFNEEEIKKIRNYNPQKYIKQLSKLSRIELENKKFSTQEINLIQSIKDTPTENIGDIVTYGVGAKVALTLKKVSYKKGKASTTAKIKGTWAWNRSPSTQNYDILAFSWGKQFNTVSKSSSGIAYCKDIHGNVKKKTTIKVWDKSPNAGCAFKFKIRGGAYGNVSSGYATVTMKHTEKAINSVETRVTYGHTAISVSPSVSWNGISVTFKKSMMNMGHKNLTLK